MAYDPLEGYHEMMSPKELAEFLGVTDKQAIKIMRQLPSTNVGGGEKRETLRVLKCHVRKRFGLPEPRGPRRRGGPANDLVG